ncbi:hypothetical protein Efla_003460 [Eimeria flavescens]
MPRVRLSGSEKPPEGWDLIAPPLLEFERQMRAVENEPHEGKRKCEALWPVFKLHHQRSRYIYECYFKRKAISKELYDYCVREGWADARHSVRTLRLRRLRKRRLRQQQQLLLLVSQQQQQQLLLLVSQQQQLLLLVSQQQQQQLLLLPQLQLQQHQLLLLSQQQLQQQQLLLLPQPAAAAAAEASLQQQRLLLMLLLTLLLRPESYKEAAFLLCLVITEKVGCSAFRSSKPQEWQPAHLHAVFILSPRGDCLISRDFRHDVPRGTSEIFLRRVRFWGQQRPAAAAAAAAAEGEGAAAACSEAPPIFTACGLSFIFLRRNGLFFVLVTQQNPAPSLLVELLLRLTKAIKDFCGVLSEEVVRRNFMLVYEVLDEICDCGYPQQSSTESLKAAIHSEAVVLDPQPLKPAQVALPSFASTSPKTMPSTASRRPVAVPAACKGGAGGAAAAARRRSEIFVDVVERLSAVLAADGRVLHAALDGCIQMKSYLDCPPVMRLALADQIPLGGNANGSGGLFVDSSNFHECVDLSLFESQRLLTFRPPDGEFVLMNYRAQSVHSVPFRVSPAVEDLGQGKAEVTVRVRADLPDQSCAANVSISVSLPKATASACVDTIPHAAAHSAEFVASEHRIHWVVKKFQASCEMTLRARLTFNPNAPPPARSEFGPATLGFEIPMYSVSSLQVRYLRVAERQGGFNPFRWVRYVTQSSSYVCRF